MIPLNCVYDNIGILLSQISCLQPFSDTICTQFIILRLIANIEFQSIARPVTDRITFKTLDFKPPCYATSTNSFKYVVSIRQVKNRIQTSNSETMISQTASDTFEIHDQSAAGLLILLSWTTNLMAHYQFTRMVVEGQFIRHVLHHPWELMRRTI